MSASNEDDEDDEYENPDENSDGAPSLASHTQKPRRPTQIRATSWVPNGEIAPVLQDKLLTDTMDEQDHLSQSTKSQLEASLGANF